MGQIYTALITRIYPAALPVKKTGVFFCDLKYRDLTPMMIKKKLKV